MKKSFLDILQDTHCEVRSDSISRKIYSVDASIYEIEPLAIAYPKSVEQLSRILQVAFDHKIPIIPRGAATGITGGCLGIGLIVDLSKYLNRILEINWDEEYAVCEPGVVQDQLNDILSSKGYRLGPDTSTGNRATLGGMLANNSAGARSLKYGQMGDHVLETELMLAGGSTLNFSRVTLEEWESKRLEHDLEGKIYQTAWEIQKNYREEILEKFPQVPRHVSGYNLHKLLTKDSVNLSQLIAGSEGTLGIATKIKVKIVRKPKITGLCIIYFDSFIESMRDVSLMLSFKPLSLEMIDRQILDAGKKSTSMKNKLGWLSGDPEAVIVVEFEGDTQEDLQIKLEAFSSKVKQNNINLLTDPTQMKDVWEVRKAGLGLLLSKRSYNRAIALIEDLSVPPEHLSEFMEKFLSYLKSKGKEAGIYGHVGAGCMHIRPYIDLRSPSEYALLQPMMLEIADLILEHRGAMSGEHGDGLVRSWLNRKMFGDELYEAFVKLKQSFDPQDLMNPGKVVNGSSVTENLRLDPNTSIQETKTFLSFTKEGGFDLAVDLCNGNGLCRKKSEVMCPSFQASGDEYDSTRARAQALRSMIHGKTDQGWTEHRIHDVLDLCIECKGCKKECPSQVDMAKMKSEFLYQFYQKSPRKLRDYLFAHLGTINNYCSGVAPVANYLLESSLGKYLLSLLDIATERPLPLLARSRFSSSRKQGKKSSRKVVLFNDTYTEFHQPEIGFAAVQVLEALNYEVIIPPWRCCGRPLISKGMLVKAQAKAETVLKTLYPYCEQGLSIVVLEPSCYSAICDDYFSLLPHYENELKVLSEHCQLLEQFLHPHLLQSKCPIEFQEADKRIKVHGHCHQKALIGTSISLEVLNAIPGYHAEEIPSGCCGVAGAFGYEKEHYDFSMKIGELRLLPYVRNMECSDIIVANGISCRSQIFHGSGRNPVHIAQVIAGRVFVG